MGAPTSPPPVLHSALVTHRLTAPQCQDSSSLLGQPGTSHALPPNARDTRGLCPLANEELGWRGGCPSGPEARVQVGL